MRRICALLLLLVSMNAVAVPDDLAARMKLADQLVELFGIRGVYDESAARCAKPASAFESDLLTIAAKHPDRFEGISPETAYWPDVRVIYAEYMNTNCAAVSGEVLRPLFVKAYAEEMTAEQLTTAIAFYSTPTGKMLAARTRVITLKITEAATKAAGLAQDQASGVFLQSMTILQSKAQQHVK